MNSSDSAEILAKFPIDILRVILNYLKVLDIVKFDTSLVNHSARSVYLQAIKGRDFSTYFHDKIELNIPQIHWLSLRQVSIPYLYLPSSSQVESYLSGSFEEDCAALIRQNSQILKTISIPNCQFNGVFFNSMRNCGNLIEIQLPNGQFSDDQFIQLIESISNLEIEKLDISGCHRLTSRSIDILCEFCPHIQGLVLGNLQFLDDLVMSKVFNACTKIRSLDLSGTLITDKSVNSILEVYPDLESLRVHDCKNVTSDLPATAARTIIRRQLVRAHSDDLRIAVVAIRSLGNLASIDVSFRDLIFSCGACEQLVSLNLASVAVLQAIVWTISMLCHVKPSPRVQDINICFPFLEQHLKDSNEEVVKDICLTLSYISEVSTEQIHRVMNFLPPILQILATTSNKQLKFAANRFVGNILTGNDEQTQAVINLGIVTVFSKLLDDEDEDIVKETCWSLSNIAAGSNSQVQALIDCDIFPKIFKLAYSAPPQIRSECIWCLANSTSLHHGPHIQYLLQLGLLEFCCWGIEKCQSDLNNVSLILQAIVNIARTDSLYHEDVVAITSSQVRLLKSLGLTESGINKMFADLEVVIPKIFEGSNVST